MNLASNAFKLGLFRLSFFEEILYSQTLFYYMRTVEIIFFRHNIVQLDFKEASNYTTELTMC